MAITTSRTTAIIVDDELHNATWLVDYLESKSLTIISAENVNDALVLLDKDIHRIAIIDLNIPVLPPIEEVILSRGESYAKFPGLFVAESARNRGYRDRQVILYSVHREREVADIAERLRISYIMKGRPQEIKKEIEFVLSFDPTHLK